MWKFITDVDVDKTQIDEFEKICFEMTHKWKEKHGVNEQVYKWVLSLACFMSERMY